MAEPINVVAHLLHHNANVPIAQLMKLWGVM